MHLISLLYVFSLAHMEKYCTLERTGWLLEEADPWFAFSRTDGQSVSLALLHAIEKLCLSKERIIVGCHS